MNNKNNETLFDYEQSKRMIEALTKEFPFLGVDVVGRTCLGRAIFSLTVGNRRNRVLLAGGFHGSEWLTCLVLFRFAEKLCRSIETKSLLCSVDISRAFMELGAVIIPCVNPDGVEIAVHGPSGARSARNFVESLGCKDFKKWNANAMGVDINHNFNAGWETLRQMEEEQGIKGPAARRFGGFRAESESETKALTRLCRLIPFRQAMAVHSQGEELYWQYGEEMPAQAHMMAKILADSCSYRLVENAGLASHGGFKDWFISEFFRPAFTLEIGKGENPLPVSMLDEIYSRIEETLTIFTLM